MEQIDIDDIVENHMLVNIGNIALTNYQIEVLKNYSINLESISNLTELMNKIDNILPNLDDDEYDELDNIYQEVAERNYYENTNK